MGASNSVVSSPAAAPTKKCLECQENSSLLKDCELLEDMFEEIYEHGTVVAQLLAANSEIVTLIVGEEKVRITCHKALLGYFSRFFEAALYGGFSEAAAMEISLPDEKVENMKCFVAWLYIGSLMIACNRGVVEIKNTHEYDSNGVEICSHGRENGPETHERKLNVLSLWVLGDKLMCPSFANSVINACLIFYDDESPYELPEVKYVFENTTPNSELRVLFKRLIAADGPLRKGRHTEDKNTTEREAWLSILENGGEIVRECVQDGFTNYIPRDDKESPFAKENLAKFMQNVPEITAEEWIKKRCP
ncbi:POZ [Glarea lozoyensis ATCC 20868]|uniref:POZ n=1 Tax=Glarea lozoyensis (strain ATCC 20868 / MF5171) TaxID=1116229 RepID=S3DIL3_GLAL2|nr:POZ [Glarea lozoyensis ATCC 20868]EPE31861.1 POZ [Glarea lozoyensis ATCC 20868]